MSLFENSDYRWRETYFVLFPSANRPTTAMVEDTLRALGDRYQITQVGSTDEGRFESVTLVSPLDFAAMDVTYLDGEDVVEQVAELRDEIESSLISADDRSKFDRLNACDARFEIFHFERMLDGDEDDESDEYLDPGALLVVLEKLADLCGGVAIDPQSGALM